MTPSGWTVRKGIAEQGSSCDVTVSTPLNTARWSIPDAQVQESVFGYILHAERVPPMLWFLEPAPGAVAEVSLNRIPCD